MHIGITFGVFIVLYIIQLFLCFKAKNKHIKLIPFYIGLVVAFLGFLLYAEFWGNMSMGFLGNGNVLLAVIIWIAVLIMYAGLLLAKITHSISKAIQRRNDK